MKKRLNVKQGVTAGLVLAVVMTAVSTGNALAADRMETFLKTSVCCAVGITLVWWLGHKINQDVTPD